MEPDLLSFPNPNQLSSESLGGGLSSLRGICFLDTHFTCKRQTTVNKCSSAWATCIIHCKRPGSNQG